MHASSRSRCLFSKITYPIFHNGTVDIFLSKTEHGYQIHLLLTCSGTYWCLRSLTGVAVGARVASSTLASVGVITVNARSSVGTWIRIAIVDICKVAHERL